MRLDINIQGGPPPGDDSGFHAAQMGGQMGALLARMSHDYPTQMIARVATDNEDGTYDCDRPGTNIYMSRVETISPHLAQAIAVGMTVLIRFFRRDRNKPYIVRVAGAQLAPGAIGPWSSAQGGPRLNFLAEVAGDRIDISTATPARIDTLSGAFAVLGDGLVTFPVNDTHRLARQAFSFYQAQLLATVVGSLDDYLYAVSISSSYGSINTFCGWHYCEAEHVLVHIWHNGTNGARIVVLDATTGIQPGSARVVDSSAITAITNTTLDFMASEGCTVCGSRLVKAAHMHSYTHGASSTTDGVNANNRSVVCLNLPDCDVRWAWDPNTIWGATPIPRFREIVATASVVSISGSTPLTSSINQDTGAANPWPYALGQAHLLPSAGPVYLESAGLAVLPLVGRVACSTDFAAWSNPDYPAQDPRNRPNPVTGQVYANGLTGLSSNLHGMRLQNFGGVGPSLNPAGELQPIFGTENSESLRAWVVALEVEATAAAGTVAWQYALPELAAEDSENYLVDSDSFAKVPSCARVTAHGASMVSQLTGAAKTASASYHSDILSPDWWSLTNYSTGGGRSLREYGTSHLAGSVEDMLYWPPGASYMWDPVLISHTGDNALGARLRTQAGLVGDSEGNVYGCYLRPKVVLSCADLWHSADQSITDRTHTAWASWNTVYNGYEADRLTLKPDMVDFYTIINREGPDAGDVDTVTPSTYTVRYYGMPHLFVMFRSFLACWNSSGTRLWQHELTGWQNEMIDNSPGLAGELAYPGVTLRIIPTSAGVFVLRLQRLPIRTTLREAGLLPSRYYTRGSLTSGFFPRPDFVMHTRDSKAVLEFRQAGTGELVWSQTVWDPTASSPSWLCGVSMFGSESGNPWVMGRVDFSTDHTAKTMWMDNPANYGSGLTRTSKVFTCDSTGDLVVRDAEPEDLPSVGIWPYDYVNSQGQSNGQTRQKAAALTSGTLYYPVLEAPSDTSYHLWKVGAL